ncbi:integrase arm-type DNA-binding domain-containing protein [Limibaculum sp. M0105]|uniref:Integrase arm-type DNA-binding domain-containing protein n=1 Tax=Thermohalobaculum xanthum TaxID=2753746 RepID=A0A8J7M8S9_9RHOB|nr:site-specific integrase [Thermohalobaculum xanthum]MBK0399813.1 integrase arm-type DNA-binding domain-containing protein [Thermohalobaculum xanthum]
MNRTADIIPLGKAGEVDAPKAKDRGRTLTQRAVETAKPGTERYEIPDASLPGFVLRVSPGGAKTYYVRTRVGRGRGARSVRVQIGGAQLWRLADAREEARRIIAEARAGVDPTDASAGKNLSDHLDDYEKELRRREVVKRSDMMTTLRRGLDGRLAPSDLTRTMIVAEIERLEATGRVGAAEYFRKTAATFLSWLVSRGAITASPMAGYRRPRSTRAERLARRRWVATGADEIRRLWDALGAISDPVRRDLVRFMLLTGQRRTETSLVEWDQIHDDRWDIPARITKTGADHSVPLGPLSLALMEAQPRLAGASLVFPGRNLRPISGWSKLLTPARKAFGDEQLCLHGLRRTYRTGLSTLGVEEAVAELMIGHKRQDLVRLYDFSNLWEKRCEAQVRWEDHIRSVVGA